MPDVREPSARPNGKASDGVDRTPLVMLLPDADSAPKPLVTGLRQRDAPFQTLASAAAAMTAVVSREARGVIIIDPKRQPRADELLRALERWAPWASRWRYEDVDGKPQLTRCPPLESTDAVTVVSAPATPGSEASRAPGQADADTTKPQGANSPQTDQASSRVADRSPSPAPPRDGVGSARYSQPESLSAEELKVLLGPSEGEDDEDDLPPIGARDDAADRLVSTPPIAGQGGRPRGENHR